MGLLSRIGKEFKGQFGREGALARGIRPESLDTLYHPEQPWSLTDYAVVAPATYGAMAAPVGALLGAAGNPDDAGPGAARGMMEGAGLAAGGVAALGSPVMMKRMVVAIARAIKHQAPDMPDEAVMQKAQQEAQKLASRPDAWEQLKQFGINDPRDSGM